MRVKDERLIFTVFRYLQYKCREERLERTNQLRFNSSNTQLFQ